MTKAPRFKVPEDIPYEEFNRGLRRRMDALWSYINDELVPWLEEQVRQ